MNTSILRRALLAILCLGTVAFAQDEKDEKKTDKVDPAAVRKEASYAIGVNIGRSIQRDQLDLDVESLAKGIRDALGDKKVELTDAEIRDAIGKLQDLSVAATKKKGADYLANNKKKKGVVVTKTGLQYEVI
ncbi:MAG: FKBP-type peptidyl-prolyl cis-trans isomerase N-terminal domain-containing protein, partial [Pirellulaceae bacterium]|nr:FKBP-type peptidyl-prolyl cis-trans isomerase N-terminal domain-containing protein [Pirellulaceae bacterium]